MYCHGTVKNTLDANAMLVIVGLIALRKNVHLDRMYWEDKVQLKAESVLVVVFAIMAMVFVSASLDTTETDVSTRLSSVKHCLDHGLTD